MPLTKTKVATMFLLRFYLKIDALKPNEGSRVSSKDEISAINFNIICKEGSEIKLTNLQKPIDYKFEFRKEVL